MAWVGNTAPTTAGFLRMPLTPSTAIVANQTTMTGPNTAPTPAVPRLWNMNRPTRIASVIQMTQCCNAGVAISVLSAVEGLEIATPALQHWVIWITLAILVGLFMFQRRGTAGVGVSAPSA